MLQTAHEIYNNNLEWVFGYGSLMWDPGFAYIDKQPATLTGFHRSFCIYSHYHRGTPEQPGLVLGLDEGGSCQGVAFRVDQSEWINVRGYLDERELIGYAYSALKIDIKLESLRKTAQAYTYIADPSHPKYAGDIGFERSVDVIMNAIGIGGLNRDYLINLLQHLKRHGYSEPNLYNLIEHVKLLTGLIDQGRGI
jgi:cation transport protein ChaC